MGRRTLNRRELRAASDAAERRETEAAEEEDVEEEEDSDDEDEADGEEVEEGEEADGESDAEIDLDEDEDAPKKKKKPAKKKADVEKPAAKPRKSRSTKRSQRMRVVWAVFNNSNNRVATFDYPKKGDADALAAKLTTDKKSTHFVQPVKEPMEEKK
jgi:hypothetical protein